jgi:hypothetical protein
MMDVEVSCKCGNVHGVIRDASPNSANRVICYCDDCQAFAHHIERADLLDEHGGSDIVQFAPATLSFDRGTEHITGVRLNPKGLYRYYASCCKTPLGNTMTPSIPFIGIVYEALRAPLDDAFGPVRARLQAQYAKGDPPGSVKTVNLPFMARTLRLILGWKLRGRARPHPFFKAKTNEPIMALPVLSKDARDALRAR